GRSQPDAHDHGDGDAQRRAVDVVTGTGGAGPIAFVTAMPMELRPFTKRLGLTKTTIAGRPAARGSLAGRDVVAIVSGIGTALAASTVEDLLAAEAPSRVLMVGI